MISLSSAADEIGAKMVAAVRAPAARRVRWVGLLMALVPDRRNEMSKTLPACCPIGANIPTHERIKSTREIDCGVCGPQ